MPASLLPQLAKLTIASQHLAHVGRRPVRVEEQKDLPQKVRPEFSIFIEWGL